MKNASKFLGEGNKVKVTIMFRGRELSHPELGMAVLTRFAEELKETASIEKAAKLLAESFKNGGKVLSCGNGGSHCDAMHFAEELTGRYRENRPGYPAIAISDVSHLSCVSNDFGYEYVFSRFVEAVGKRRAIVLFGLSTSGNSKKYLKCDRSRESKRYESDCDDR